MTGERPADDQDSSAATGQSSRRPVFGPLFYSTLVIAAVVILCVGALRVSEVVNGAVVQRREASPGEALSASVEQLKSANGETRSAGVKGLAGILLSVGPAGELSDVRTRAIVGLRQALGDVDPQVRTDAASALGVSAPLARSAKAELSAALNDRVPEVRIAAARALLTNKDDSPGPALDALAKMLADPMPTGDRSHLVTAMRSAGQPGTDAAVRVLERMLSSRNELLCFEALACIPALALDASRLTPAVEPLFKSDNPEMRCFAILAAVQAVPEDQRPKPALLSALEGAVIDASLTLGLRQKALEQLSMRAPKRLVHCGRELARQLDNDDYNARLAAATLLHMIEPEVLAGQNGPDSEP